jgi:iron(III) transport system substrate-binding protein
MQRSTRLAAGLAVSLALLAAACGGDDSTATTTAAPDTTAPALEGSLTVYSGRGEDLVGPLLEQFSAATGIDVEVRYGNSSEMLLLIQEEGSRSPADVYYSQGAGFLGVLSNSNNLLPLDDEILNAVPEGLRSPQGDWVGLSGRARVAVYNVDVLTEAELPDSLLDFTDPAWNGRVGWAPTNASFQDHITAMRALIGEDATRTWLTDMLANGVVPYENNRAILQAVADGEVDVGLVNHYYLYVTLAENPDFPVANKYYGDGDVGALVNIAGAGIVASTDVPELAAELMRFLVSVEAQEYFAQQTYEIPVIAGAAAPVELPSLDSLNLPAVDLNVLEDLQGTVALLTEVGAL